MVDNLAKFFSEVLVISVVIYVAWLWYDRRKVIEKDEQIAKAKEIKYEANLHNHIAGESVEKLISEPDDIRIAADGSEEK